MTVTTVNAETDPVCGMKVNPATAKFSHDHAGTTYWFCSAGCRTKFIADPARFLAPKPPPSSTVVAPPHGAVVEYTCPMHPQVV